MKFKIGKTLCKIGLHKKYTFINEREVNWILMSHKITKCRICNKIF